MTGKYTNHAKTTVEEIASEWSEHDFVHSQKLKLHS